MARPVQIGTAVTQFMRESGLDKPILESQLVDRWPELMGPLIAGMTRSVEVENGVLKLRLSNAALRAQLFEQRHELVTKLNEKLGAQVLRDVRLLG